MSDPMFVLILAIGGGLITALERFLSSRLPESGSGVSLGGQRTPERQRPG